MAHVQKLKAGAVAPMVAHWERVPELERGFERENIDSARTSLNYNLRPHDVSAVVKAAMEEHGRTAGRACRSDANVLFDWVVTLPKDCPTERSREFFEACAEFLEQRYGKENVVGAYVHMDETTPHMHVPIVPMMGGKLQASRMVNRRDLQTFHKDLNKAVDKALGVHVSIELDESQKAEKALSSLGHDEYKQAQRRLEELRREEASLAAEVEQLESAYESRSESARAIIGGIGAGKREKELRSEIKGLRERVGGLEGKNERARERVRVLEDKAMGLRGGVARLAERCRSLAFEVKEALLDLGRVDKAMFSARALAWAKASGLEMYDSRSLEYIGRQAREASRARNQQRSAGRPRSRDR